MQAFKDLISHEGRWRGTNRLQVSEAEGAEDSLSTLTVVPMLAGRFVRIDQTWSWNGKPQDGSLLIGFQQATHVVTAHWIDTFHMGNKVMACEGIVNHDGLLDVRGEYAAPPGPNWGWRITIDAKVPDRLEITMCNIEPGGKEEFAVLATYSRVGK